MPLAPMFDPTTGASGGAAAGSNTSTNAWNSIEDYDWTAQSTSAILSGAGTATMGGKSITNALVSGTPGYTSQVISGTGLQFVGTAAGAGGAVLRWEAGVSNYNPGEPILLELLLSGCTFGAAGAQLYGGIGSGTHYSQSEWHGAQVTSLAGNTTTNHISRGYSTTGGVRTVTVASAVAISTDYLVQVWFDGSYMSRVGIADAQTTYLTQPVLGNSAPFASGLDVGTTGTGGSVAPATPLGGAFATTLRVILGFATQNMTFNLKRHRLSRMTRM